MNSFAVVIARKPGAERGTLIKDVAGMIDMSGGPGADCASDALPVHHNF